METRLGTGENESITWQKQLMSNEKNISTVNVWRSKDPNVGDYATWPLEMSSESILYYYGKPLSWRGVPIVLKLDTEDEQL